MLLSTRIAGFLSLLTFAPLFALSQNNIPATATSTASPTKTSAPWKQTYLPDGQPDWQGYWDVSPKSDTYDITGATVSPTTPQATEPGQEPQAGNAARQMGARRVTGTPDGLIPYQAWAAAHHQDISDHHNTPTKPEYIDTQARCLLNGPGRVFIHAGFEIIQTPGYIVFIADENDEQIIVPIDAGPHVGKNVQLWQGDRRGHWEGNTLVVDVTNLKAKSRLDMSGNFYSPSAHFVERFTRIDANTIRYQATVTDPAVYTKPWQLNMTFAPEHKDDPTYELWEDSCHEGERSADAMVISAEAEKVLEDAAAKAKAKAGQGTKQH